MPSSVIIVWSNSTGSSALFSLDQTLSGPLLPYAPAERLSTVQVSHTSQPTKHEDSTRLSLLKRLGEEITEQQLLTSSSLDKALRLFVTIVGTKDRG
jgi:hypothetical protein